MPKSRHLQHSHKIVNYFQNQEAKIQPILPFQSQFLSLQRFNICMPAQYFRCHQYLIQYIFHLSLINISFGRLHCTFKNKNQVPVEEYLYLVKLYLVYSTMNHKPQAKVEVILKSVQGVNETIELGTFYFSILKSIAVYSIVVEKYLHCAAVTAGIYFNCQGGAQCHSATTQI